MALYIANDSIVTSYSKGSDLKHKEKSLEQKENRSLPVDNSRDESRASHDIKPTKVDRQTGCQRRRNGWDNQNGARRKIFSELRRTSTSPVLPEGAGEDASTGDAHVHDVQR